MAKNLIQNSCDLQNVTAASGTGQVINPFGMQLVQSISSTSSNVDFLNLNQYPSTAAPYKNFLLIGQVQYSVANGNFTFVYASSTASSFTSQLATRGYVTEYGINLAGTVTAYINQYGANAEFCRTNMYGGTIPQYYALCIHISGINTTFVSSWGHVNNMQSTNTSDNTNHNSWLNGNAFYPAVVPAFRLSHGGGTVSSGSYQLYALPS